MKRLEGKNALIVGAACGIGRAFAEAHMAESARVALPGIDIAWARRSAEEIGPAAIVVEIDSARQDFIGTGVANSRAVCGGIDILINVATIFTAAPFVGIPRDDRARVFDINVNAITPGVVDGEHWDGVYAFIAKYEGGRFGRKKREVGSSVSCGCAGWTGALAGRAIFLAFDEADCIVATCDVDGGQRMS